MAYISPEEYEAMLTAASPGAAQAALLGFVPRPTTTSVPISATTGQRPGAQVTQTGGNNQVYGPSHGAGLTIRGTQPNLTVGGPVGMTTGGAGQFTTNPVKPGGAVMSMTPEWRAYLENMYGAPVTFNEDALQWGRGTSVPDTNDPYTQGYQMGMQTAQSQWPTSSSYADVDWSWLDQALGQKGTPYTPATIGAAGTMPSLPSLVNQPTGAITMPNYPTVTANAPTWGGTLPGIPDIYQSSTPTGAAMAASAGQWGTQLPGGTENPTFAGKDQAYWEQQLLDQAGAAEAANKATYGSAQGYLSDYANSLTPLNITDEDLRTAQGLANQAAWGVYGDNINAANALGRAQVGGIAGIHARSQGQLGQDLGNLAAMRYMEATKRNLDEAAKVRDIKGGIAGNQASMAMNYQTQPGGAEAQILDYINASRGSPTAYGATWMGYQPTAYQPTAQPTMPTIPYNYEMYPTNRLPTSTSAQSTNGQNPAYADWEAKYLASLENRASQPVTQIPTFTPQMPTQPAALAQQPRGIGPVQRGTPTANAALFNDMTKLRAAIPTPQAVIGGPQTTTRGGNPFVMAQKARNLSVGGK